MPRGGEKKLFGVTFANQHSRPGHSNADDLK
jgi:hypothetical protein